MIVLLIFAALLPLGGILCAISRSRYGHLRLSELPGFVWVMLAGPEYRRAAAAILASRARRGTLPQVSVRPVPQFSIETGCPSCDRGYAHALHPRERES